MVMTCAHLLFILYLSSLHADIELAFGMLGTRKIFCVGDAGPGLSRRLLQQDHETHLLAANCRLLGHTTKEDMK